MDKVLIAEDDKIFLKLLASTLGKYGDKFHVIPVQDGQEAIDVLKQQEISMLVTDIQMPRVDGLALLAYVSEHHPNLPCFVMSAYGTPQMKARLPKDLLHFFPKPFEADDLARAIIETLDRDIARDGLHGMSLESFLHMIGIENASCILEIRSLDKATGMLYFKDGVLLDAECGGLNGEDAALELFKRKQTSFGFKFFPPEKITRRIEMDIDQLLRKAIEEKKKPNPGGQFRQKRYKFT